MRGIEKLHPELQIIARQFEDKCKAAGLNVLITETLRTTAEQDALYAQGRTAPGNIVTNCQGSTYQSPHQWGVAFDFCKNVKGHEFDDAAFFKQVGAIGKSLGLFWGGDFKSYYDGPHLEWPKYLPNNSTATLKTNFGKPEEFMKIWTTPIEAIPAPVVDNTPDAYAKIAVDKAVNSGVLKGNDKGDLLLHSPVTRQDLLVILDRAGVL